MSKYAHLFAIALLLVTTIVTAQAQDGPVKSPFVRINEAAANSDITVEQLSGNVSVLFGSGGNIVVLNGRKAPC